VYNEQFNFKNAKALTPGKKYEGDDPSQDGGDIVFGRDGQAVEGFIHISKSAPDRPNISNFISMLQVKV